MAQIMGLAQTSDTASFALLDLALLIRVLLVLPFDGKMRQKSVVAQTVFWRPIYKGHIVGGHRVNIEGWA